MANDAKSSCLLGVAIKLQQPSDAMVTTPASQKEEEEEGCWFHSRFGVEFLCSQLTENGATYFSCFKGKQAIHDTIQDFKATILQLSLM